jgi:hypothetical protein
MKKNEISRTSKYELPGGNQCHNDADFSDFSTHTNIAKYSSDG